MLRDSLLAMGLLLSTASQLRPGGSPVGLGELFLVAWSLLMLFRQMAPGGLVLTPALSVLLRFWGLFTFAETLGFGTGLALDVRTDPQWLIHDVMAYPLVAIVSCLLGVETASRIRRVAWLLALLGTVALAVQLAAAVGLVQIPSMEPWYWDRLRGWSANPNQLALLCAALSLMCLHLADTAISRSERIGALICAILPVVVGRMTGSDTFTLMLLAAVLVFLVLKLGTWLHAPSPSPKLQPRVAFVLMFVIAIPMLAASMVPAALSMSTGTDDLAMGLMKNGGKAAHEEADLRFALWQQAIIRGMDTGMLGLGPGPHLAIPPLLVNARASEGRQPDNIQHPQNNGVPNFEAHNTILDLFVQGGLLADLSFLWLLGRAFLYGYRGRLAGLTTLLCCLTFFGMTNLIIRQPLFWFAIVSCLVAGSSRMLASSRASLRLVRINRSAEG
jgi:O-antigen ligase